MSADEALAVRTKLGQSVDEMAADLGLTPGVVRGWEEGAVRIPARIAKILRWQEGRFDRFTALEQSGLPECAWLVAAASEAVPNEFKAIAARLERLRAHQESCEVCLARQKLIDEKFGGWPEYPMHWWTAAMAWMGKRVGKLPTWARPAAWSGMGFGAYTLLMIAVRIPALMRDPNPILTALAALLGSVTLGAAIGLVYAAFRALKSRWQAQAN